MKIIQAIIMTILVFSFLQNTFATEPIKDPIDETYLALKKWGLSYCLAAHSQDNGMEIEAKAAMEWYSTRGLKDDTAFMAIKKYFDKEIENDHGVGKHGGNVNLIKCLNAYKRAEYDKLLLTLYNH